MGWRRLFDSPVGRVVDAWTGDSHGSLKDRLAAVIDEYWGRSAKVEEREGKREGGSKGEMMKAGALNVLVLPIYSTLYT